MTLLHDFQTVHKAVVEAARSLREGLKNEEAPAVLNRLRINLASVVRERLGDQQRLLSTMRPVYGNDTADHDRLLTEDRELRLSYSKHIGTWNGAAMEKDTTGYAAAVDSLVARMERYFQDIERELRTGL